MVFDIVQLNMIKLVPKKFPAFKKLIWSKLFTNLVFDQQQVIGFNVFP